MAGCYAISPLGAEIFEHGFVAVRYTLKSHWGLRAPEHGLRVERNTFSPLDAEGLRARPRAQSLDLAALGARAVECGFMANRYTLGPT